MKLLGSVNIAGYIGEASLAPEESPSSVKVGRLWLNNDGILRICTAIVNENPLWKILDNVNPSDLEAAGALLDSDVFALQRGAGLYKTPLSDILAKFRRAAPQVTITGASATLALSHMDSWLNCSHTAAQTITIPPQASVAWPADVQLEGCQYGVGAVTFAAGSGVTIRKNSKITQTTDGQYAPWGLKRLSPNEWMLFGQMVAA